MDKGLNRGEKGSGGSRLSTSFQSQVERRENDGRNFWCTTHLRSRAPACTVNGRPYLAFDLYAEGPRCSGYSRRHRLNGNQARLIHPSSIYRRNAVNLKRLRDHSNEWCSPSRGTRYIRELCLYFVCKSTTDLKLKSSSTTLDFLKCRQTTLRQGNGVWKSFQIRRLQMVQQYRKYYKKYVNLIIVN